jgi:hypothetical protein
MGRKSWLHYLLQNYNFLAIFVANCDRKDSGNFLGDELGPCF